MAALRQKTEETTARLRARGFTVIEMWEHEFIRMKQASPDLMNFCEKHMLKERLNPRNAFFGGRTNAVKLYHEGDAKYVDFTSLYPWVISYFIFL